MNFLQVVFDKQMLKWIFFVSALLFASSINAQESFRQIEFYIEKPVICGTQPDIFEKIQEAGEDDIQRRNTIAILLQDWNLIDIVKKEDAENKAPLSQIKVLPFKEKKEWNLSAKYNIGKKVTKEDSDNADTEV